MSNLEGERCIVELNHMWLTMPARERNEIETEWKLKLNIKTRMSKKRERGWRNKNDRWARDGREGEMAMVDGILLRQTKKYFRMRNTCITYVFIHVYPYHLYTRICMNKHWYPPVVPGCRESSPGYPILHFMALLAFPNSQTLENEERLVGPRLSNGRNATCPWAHRAHQCHGAGQAPGLAVLSYTCGHWRLLGGYWDTVAGWTGGLGQPPHGVAGVLFIPVSIR